MDNHQRRQISKTMQDVINEQNKLFIIKDEYRGRQEGRKVLVVPA